MHQLIPKLQRDIPFFFACGWTIYPGFSLYTRSIKPIFSSCSCSERPLLGLMFFQVFGPFPCTTLFHATPDEFSLLGNLIFFSYGSPLYILSFWVLSFVWTLVVPLSGVFPFFLYLFIYHLLLQTAGEDGFWPSSLFTVGRLTKDNPSSKIC